MKHFYTKIQKVLPEAFFIKSLVLIFMIGVATLRVYSQFGLCEAGVPFYQVDLSHSASASFISPSDSRANNPKIFNRKKCIDLRSLAFRIKHSISKPLI